MATKSARYGKGFEYEIRDMLREATGIDSFERTPQSGAWIGKSNSYKIKTAREDMIDIMAGDIVTPEGWRWCIECKNHEDVPVHQLYFGEECKTINEFLGQIYDDSLTTGKQPLLIFKVRRKPYTFKSSFVKVLKEANIKKPQVNSITTGIMAAELGEYCDELKDLNHIQYTTEIESGDFQTWKFFDFDSWLKMIKIRQFKY